MATVKVAITIEEKVLRRLDALVAQRGFSSRSRAIQIAVEAQLDRLDRSALARESAKLDTKAEQRFANEGASPDLAEWPEY